MSIFSWIFRNKNKSGEELNISLELSSLIAFETELGELLNADRFIARSDYRQMVADFADFYRQMKALQDSDVLTEFSNKRHIAEDRLRSFLSLYKELNDEKVGSATIAAHNDSFVKSHLDSEQEYLDNILKEVDPAIKLDDEQRRVVLSDEDYTLVIAGAGAGKTTTVAAKVKYLVERKGIHPDQILVISYTNKAVGELRDKINKALKIDCPVTTFHKTGYAILRRQDEDRKTVVDQGFMFHIINNYLKGNILENPELVDKLILFFGSYFEAPYEGDDLNDFFN